MRKNEANWKKWYLTNTHREWQDQDAMTRPDFEGLDDHTAEVGALLYRRYVMERQNAAERQDEQAELLAQADAQGRQQLQNAAMLSRYLPETARAAGQSGTRYAEDMAEQIRASAAGAVRQSQTKRNSAIADLLTRYRDDNSRQDARLASELAATDRRYQAMWDDKWQSLTDEMQQRLPQMVSSVDDTRYTAEGVDSLLRMVEDNRQALGNRYDDAVAWVRALPVVDESVGHVVDTASGRIAISDADWNMADAVHYRRGAGTAVTRMDLFTVEYNGTRYQLKADRQVDDATDSTLTALAEAKQLTLGTGTMMYYRNRLYVYSGSGHWMDTRNVGLSSSNSLDKLLQHIRTDMHQ